MTLTALFDSPFFTGTTTPTGDVPGKFMVAIGGRGFLVDLDSGQFQRQSIPLLRNQADASLQPNEASINPEDLWRRTASSFHKGSGQRNYDAPQESDPGRYWVSKGVDPWTKGELSLLPATDEKKTSANTNLALCPAGAYLYLADGSALQYTQDITAGTPAWTTVTGTPGTVNSITTDGYKVWTSYGSGGIYETVRGTASAVKVFADGIAFVSYVNGRLFGSFGADLWNIIDLDSGSPPTYSSQALLLTQPNSDWTWTAVTAAAGHFFFAGFAGDKSMIYACEVKPDGTALTTPIVVAELPDGEIVRSLQGYLGFLLVGTDRGIRFANPDTSGNLTVGGEIELDHPVRCFEGQGRFVWFGWSQYDTTSTGLGRMDLSAFNDTRPSYASDLMCTENGEVTSVATFQDIRVYAVSGDGVFAEDTVRVPEGSFTSGRIGYGLFDPKVSRVVTVSHLPLDGSISAEMARDGGDFVQIGITNTTLGSVRSDFTTNLARGELFELRFTLTRSLTDMTTGPTVGRYTLRAYPAAARSERITVPLIIAKDQVDQSGGRYGRSPEDDLQFLAALESDGQSVSYQEGAATSTVVVEDHVWLPHHQTKDKRSFNGTYVVQLKRFAGE